MISGLIMCETAAAVKNEIREREINDAAEKLTTEKTEWFSQRNTEHTISPQLGKPL